MVRSRPSIWSWTTERSATRHDPRVAAAQQSELLTPPTGANGNGTNGQRFSRARERAGRTRGERPGGRGETPPAQPNARPRNIPKCLLTRSKSCIPPGVGGHPLWVRRPSSQMGNWSTDIAATRLCLAAQAVTASPCLPHLANTASRCPGFVRRFRPLIRFRGEVIL